MSSTLSTPGSASGAAAPAPVDSAKPRSKPHIIAFDAIRLIIMVFVVSVHTLSFATGRVTLSVGTVTTIFHTSRELFLVLTALVLTYNYGRRPLRVGRFWRRRYWLVLPAYVTWSVIYYAADGAHRGAFPGALITDLQDAGARYHLYFLLVSMQIYLLFPVIRWVLRKTEGYHAWLFGIALAYQTWLTIGLHYKVGREGNGGLAQFLNGAGQGYWIDTYVFYIVAGALAGWHFDQLCAFTRRHLRSAWRVALVTATGVAAGVGVYFIEIEVYGATPGSASAVFQPVVIFETLVFSWALLGAGLLWSDRGAPGKKFAAAGSASSFGIYLAHPLVLQALLLIVGSHYFGSRGGLTGWMHRLPHPSLEVLIVLFVFVPVIYACAWVIASTMRRTPLSLFITGREWKPKRKTRLGQATDRMLDKAGDILSAGYSRIPRLVIAGVLVVAVLATTGAITEAHIQAVANRKMNTTVSSIQVGDMSRSYTVLTPAKKKLSATAPIIVALSGLNAEQYQEINRDKLTPYAISGEAEVVYPLPYRESWNAIGCCSWAGKANVDDVGFLQALVKKIDPGNARPIYLMGYSNGGRLAYTIACKDPLLFDGIAAVKADPMPWCNVQVPQKFLQISSIDDTDTPWYTGEKGKFREMPAAQVQNAILRYTDGCSTKSASSHEGNMTLTTWSDCKAGSSVTFAVYTKGVHSYPRPPGSYPDASQVIWAWIHDTTTVSPLPSTK